MHRDTNSDVRLIIHLLDPIFTLPIFLNHSVQKKDTGHNYTSDTQCQSILSINIYSEVLRCQALRGKKEVGRTATAYDLM